VPLEAVIVFAPQKLDVVKKLTEDFRLRTVPRMVERDPAEIERLVTENMKLAHYFALKWKWRDHDDALSIAMEGLLRAAEYWDASVGVPFGSYASILIQRQQQRHQQHENRGKRKGKREHLSLDFVLGEGDQTYGEILEDPNAKSSLQVMLSDEEWGLLEALLQQIDARQRLVLEMRFGLNGSEIYTLEEVGKKIGVTRERVRQIELQAMKSMYLYRRRIEGEPEPARTKRAYRRRVFALSCPV
jgi:RNA polymerase sigma factor (sigma-70 family)